MVTLDISDPDMRSLVEMCDRLAIEGRYKQRLTASQKIRILVPEGPTALAEFTRAEGYLIALGIVLDWRLQPHELVRRTVADTLRLVGKWLPKQQAEELVLGPAFAVRGWVPDGRACPVCQEDFCDEDCPMSRLGGRGAPAVEVPGRPPKPEA